MEEDTWAPIVLESAFLASAGWHIDVKNGTLTFDVGDVHVEFNLLKAANFPSICDECNKVDVVDSLMREIAPNINDLLELLMLNSSTADDENPEVPEFAKLLQTSPLFPLSSIKVELLQDESKLSSD